MAEHDGAAAVLQQDGAAAAQHDVDDEQHPQAFTGAADTAPIEAIARMAENNLNMQISFDKEIKGYNTS